MSKLSPSRMMVALLLAASVSFFVVDAGPGRSESFRARVTRVVDGDTIVVKNPEGRRFKLRISTIDCPESHQAHGRDATRYVRRCSLDRDVTVEVVGRDCYSRYLANVALPDGTDLGECLVAAGLAWRYPLRGKDAEAVARDRRRFAHHRHLGRLQRRAREAGIGLWIDEDPMPPWAWRHRDR